MLETETFANKSIATLIDPQTDESFGKISLVGDPISASQWISASGDLQSFVILGSREDLWDVWVQQKEVLLRSKYSQRLVKIVTYPAEGETQGYLDLISEAQELVREQPKLEQTKRTQRGLAFLQSLLST
jgi:hypothetical protein